MMAGYDGFLVMFVVGFLAVKFLKFYFSDSPVPTVKKENLLVDDAINKKLPQSDEYGVLSACLPNGEPYNITTADRAVVIGPPGTGKTSFLITQLRRWTDTHRSFICLDVKPEIEQIMRKTLEEKGYKIIVYNPTNPKDTYNFLHDLDTDEAVGELASALIPSEDAKNAVFNESARDLLDALILHIKAHRGSTASFVDVYDTLVKYDNITALLNDLQHSKSTQTREIVKTLKIIADNERLLGSIFATFVSNLRFLRYENIRSTFGSGGFTLSELCKPKTALFLQFEEASNKTTDHLFSVFVGHVLRYLISNTDREAVLCLLDEIGNAGVVSDLTGKLNTIRSRNMPTWLYWQSVEQMQKYGVKANEGANIILGACDYQMIYRLNDNATAQYFADRIGTQEAIHRNYSETTADKTTSNTTSENIQREYVIFPHELQQLETGAVIAIYRGIAWRGKTISYKQEDEEKAANEAKEIERRKAEFAAEKAKQAAKEKRQRQLQAAKDISISTLKTTKNTGQKTLEKTVVAAKGINDKFKRK